MIKTDLRIEHTKHAIKSALLTLLQNKKLEQVTVKELCENAKINRATFYSHYASLPHLMEEIEYEECKQLFDILDEVIVDTEHLHHSTLIMLQYLKEHPVLREIFLASNSVGSGLTKLTQERLKKSVNTITQNSELSGQQAEWILNFIIYGMRELLRQWFYSNQENEEEFTMTITNFITHGVFGIFRND